MELKMCLSYQSLSIQEVYIMSVKSKLIAIEVELNKLNDSLYFGYVSSLCFVSIVCNIKDMETLVTVRRGFLAVHVCIGLLFLVRYFIQLYLRTRKLS
jgi:hypothetical protein